MSFKDILVHVDSTGASRLRLQVALTLAGRFDARLSGLHVIPKPDVPPYFKPSVVERVAKISRKMPKWRRLRRKPCFAKRQEPVALLRRGNAPPAIWKS